METEFTIPIILIDPGLFSEEKPIEWKRRQDFLFLCLYLLSLFSEEKPIEWKLKVIPTLIGRDYGLFSEEKPIEWKLIKKVGQAITEIPVSSQKRNQLNGNLRW